MALCIIQRSHFCKVENNVEDYRLFIQMLMNLLRYVDYHTYHHCLRVRNLSMDLAYTLEISDHEIYIIEIAALLHDIGKLVVPKNILLKSSQFSEQEWLDMKKHSEYGQQIVTHIGTVDATKIGEIIRHHHEFYSGKGYPDGLKGEKIPLYSRIISIADVFDALMNDRPYREAYQKSETIAIIKSQKGLQFDPEITEIFLKIIN